jgi:ribonuclease P protein component
LAPTSAGFPRTARLTDATEFNRVFKTASFRRVFGPLRVLVVTNRQPYARIGVVVGKRAVRRSVDRNRIKRVIRDTFRQQRFELPAVDIVVQVQISADNRATREGLANALLDIRKRFA